MKILKIFGAVLAVHLLAFVFIFTSPGCQTGPRSIPTPDSTVATGMGGAPAPSAAFNEPVSTYTPAASAGRAAPTRPGSPNAAAITPARPVVSNVTPVSSYTVERGDSLWSIAKKNHLTVAELAKANSLSVSSTLQPGQKLIIPGQSASTPMDLSTGSADGPSTYTVLSGDTMATIARKHGITTAQLRAANNRSSDIVRLGETLNLPSSARPATTVNEPTATAAARGADAVTHTVQSGEVLGAIARKYGVTVAELAAANNITDLSKVRAGQTLVIPGFKTPGGSRPASTPATTAGTAPAEAPVNIQLTPPPPGQDLDAGLKEATTEVPTIKVEDPPKN